LPPYVNPTDLASDYLVDVVVVAGDLLEVQPKLETLGLGKMQVLEPTGAGKIKYLKAGSTSLPKKKTPYNPPADLRK